MRLAHDDRCGGFHRGCGIKALFMTAALLPAFAGAQSPTTDGQRRIETELRLGLERIELPHNEGMGLLGASYLFKALPGLRAGPAMYGAVSGRRGGFFTFGAEGAWQRPLPGPLEIQLGLYAGAGGGGAAPVGDGLMWRPHAELLWNSGGYRTGVSISQVRFSNSPISSRQVGIVMSLDTRFNYFPADSAAALSAGETSGLGFDRLLAVAGAYRPSAGTMDNAGKPLGSVIGLVGVRAERLLDAPFYWGVEANGAVSGGVTGYAEFFAEGGVEAPVIGEWLRLGGRLALGTGGGGAMPVGGGLLFKAAAYGTARLAPSLAVALEGGWTHAPQGEFSAPFGALTLNWVPDRPGSPPAATREEASIGLETYRDTARNAGPSRSLQNIAFKFNRFLGESPYVTGQVHSAWNGEAGGFFDGLVGAGLQWRTARKWLTGVEVLAGAAGGGGVDTGSGAIVQTMLYTGYRLSSSASLRAGAGRLRSTQGPLASMVLGLDLAFAFGAGHRN